MIPVSEIATEFKMLSTGEIVGAEAVPEKPQKAPRRRKNRVNLREMRTGFALVRTGVIDF